MTRHSTNSSKSLSIFTKSIRIWVLWCWNVPVSNRLRVLFSGKLTSLFSVGVHCWIMPMRLQYTEISTGMSSCPLIERKSLN